MLSRGFTIGRIGGSPVVVTWSWLIVAALLTTLYQSQLAEAMGTGRAIGIAGAFVALLFGSVFLHELAHGWAARRRGIGVREYALTFFGGHTAFTRTMPNPGAAGLVAFAGPAANAALAVGFGLLERALPDGLAAALSGSAAWANGFVAVLNLIPALPLDGGALLEAAVWRLTGRRASGTLAAGWVGVAAGGGLALWGMASAGRDWTGSIWWVIVGLWVAEAAWSSVKAARGSAALEAVAVAGLARPAAALDHRAPVIAALPALTGKQYVVVTERGLPVGY
ncbi:MAG: site-2 protease family protein, partial [Bifidobacteriaceae bacterium]|nr:site-2 protease family protein [Bifidobacteriaceae bacterium]